VASVACGYSRVASPFDGSAVSNGWLVFEREDGRERRRFNQVPDDWASLSKERLALLCQVAVPVVAPKNTPSGAQPVMARPDSDPR
jgi:hypothetical protein